MRSSEKIGLLEIRADKARKELDRALLKEFPHESPVRVEIRSGQINLTPAHIMGEGTYPGTLRVRLRTPKENVVDVHWVRIWK